MENKVIVINYNSIDPTGNYPEDEFYMHQHVENAKDVFNFLKRVKKVDASHFGNYPFSGKFDPYDVYFTMYKWFEYKGEIYRTDTGVIKTPDYYYKALEMYNEWWDNIRKRLPRLRAVRDKRIKKERELTKLHQLKEKYE